MGSMLRAVCVGTVAAGVMLVGAGCGDGGAASKEGAGAGSVTASGNGRGVEATSTPTADLVVLRSGEHLAAATSYRLTYTITAGSFEGTIDGDGVYGRSGAAWARMSVSGEPVADEDIRAYLFLPPNLYLERGNGDWLVQSPWNQGVRADQQEFPGVVDPIVDYAQITRVLRDPRERPDDVSPATGSGAQHYRAKVNLRDVPSLARDAPADVEATVDLWIDVVSELPKKMRIRVGGSDPGQVSIEFADYNVAAVAPPVPDSARPLRDAQFPDAPCTADALAGCLAAQTAIGSTATCEGTGRRVCLAPLGMVSTGLVDHLVAYYRAEYGLDVTVLRPSAIPVSFEDANRQQVDAAGLIKYMETLFPEAYVDPDAVLIGLTPIDVYDATSTFRYVFGVKRTATNPKAVVSSSRMDPLFYGEPEDQALFFSRTRKMFSKYVGLLYYRLTPSPDPASPMYDSIGGPRDVDNMTEPLPVPH